MVALFCYNAHHMKNHTWTIVGGAAVLLLIASFWYASYANRQANEGIAFESHVKGNPEAEVVLVEYSDFQCPACGQAYPVLEEIIDEHGDNLRFEYRHFPLITIHPYAVPAAAAAEAAGQQGEFWAMHAKLFENQSAWSRSSNPNAHFEQYAEEIGLDMSQYRRQFDASAVRDKIDEEFDEARALGFGSTPSFTLNGEPLEFQTYQELRDQIETAIGATSTASTSTPSATVEFSL